MSKSIEPSIRIPISPEFFCDGGYYVLTSTSLGGGNFTPSEISTSLGDGNEAQVEELLKQGVCIPLFFEADCEIDRGTLFVIGDLTEEEASGWVGKLVAKLNIPCGKLVLLCGGGHEDMIAEAISGNPPNPNYVVFQAIDVPPDEYQVEIYAYLPSSSARNYIEDRLEEQEPSIQDWFHRNQYDLEDGIGYIIRLTPLTTEPPLPKLVPEVGWCGVFDYQKPRALK
ncbi:DUF4261 domain-containing protein [Tumidithrix helvetica PCC 7403]|uniref:hypothetical protein n=1 Tax=Tumidithrix helvetica TaxID=3457545 RepID=UPI003C9BC2E3